MAGASGDPQSLNLYAYTQNIPTDFIDPTGLYTACAHQAMTKFIGNLAKIGPHQAQQIANYTGAGPQAADSPKYAATNFFNWGPAPWHDRAFTLSLHFATDAQLAEGASIFAGALRYGQSGAGDAWRGYQAAGFILHAIQDALGAHANYRQNPGLFGHGLDTADPTGIVGNGTDPDTVLGDANFIAAANRTFQVMSNSNRTLTARQINQLIDAILKACGNGFKVIRSPEPQGAIGGGPGGGYAGGTERMPSVYPGGGYSGLDWLWWWYNQQGQGEDDGTRYM